MRPRLIQSVPGLDPNDTPFERFRKFARRLAQIPKAEADKNTDKPIVAKTVRDTRKSKRGILNV
jgi:hypothetical protein